MRTLHVLEVKNTLGEFLPRIGFADVERLQFWMSEHLPDLVMKQVSEWRIVEYVPASVEPDPTLLH